MSRMAMRTGLRLSEWPRRKRSRIRMTLSKEPMVSSRRDTRMVGVPRFAGRNQQMDLRHIVFGLERHGLSPDVRTCGAWYVSNRYGD